MRVFGHHHDSDNPYEIRDAHRTFMSAYNLYGMEYLQMVAQVWEATNKIRVNGH